MSFLVWNPARGMPTVAHPTIESASAEAARLSRQHPGQHFLIMSPVLTEDAANTGKAWSAGANFMAARAERAEANAKRMIDDAIQYEAKVKRRFRSFEEHQRRYQAIVADCLLWFDGFAAAFGTREGWEQPRIPDRDTIRDLNRALLNLEQGQPIPEEEIPF